MIIIVIISTLMMLSMNEGAPNNNESRPVYNQTKYSSLKFFSEGPPDGALYYRTVALTDNFFDYKKPCYKGGFFIGMQVGALKKYIEEDKVDFNTLKNIRNYVLHYKENISARSGTWYIPSYQVHYIELPPTLTLETFDIDSYQGEWLPYQPLYATHKVPDSFDADRPIYQYANENQHPSLNLQNRIQQSNNLQGEALQRDTLSPEYIEQLKSENRYDTIVETDDAYFYINTDRIVCELSKAPDVFHFIHKEFYPDGKIKHKSYWMPGIYRTYEQPMGFTYYFDPQGEVMAGGFRHEESNYGFVLQTPREWIIEFVEREGHIDRSTGRGKPVMKINQHVDPHAKSYGETRLMVEAKWQFTTDASSEGYNTDNESTISILIRHDDGSETAYIIDKTTRVILDKFKR